MSTHTLAHKTYSQSSRPTSTHADPRRKNNSQEVILFVHRRKANNKKFMLTLESVIRDAWLDLKMSDTLTNKAIENLFNSEDDHFKSVVRFGVLHNLKQ